VQGIFVCGSADVAFCPPDFTRRIIERIAKHNVRAPYKNYYLQSKKPACFRPFLADLPKNVILLTTLETNRDAGYRKISKAPLPSVRYEQFKSLEYPRKVVTIEPVLDFDPEELARMIWKAQPEFVNIGADSKGHGLKEPSKERLAAFISLLGDAKVPIRKKINLGRILGT